MPGLIPEATGTPAGAGGGVLNPFEMMNSLMGLKLKMNENQQFQSQYMANQAFGEIMAHAPSMEEGLNQAQQNPSIMAFGGQALQTARAVRALQLQGMETKQKLGQSGYEGALQSTLQAANDPINYNKYIDNAIKLVDPEVQNRVRPQLEALRDSIGHKIQGFNLSDPAQADQAKQAVTALVAGAAGAAGTDQSHIAPFMRTTTLDAQGIPIMEPSPLERAQGAVPSLAQTSTAPQAPATPPVVTNSSSGEKYPLDVSGVKAYQNIGKNGQPVMSMYGRPTINENAYGTMDKQLKESYAGDERASYIADKGLLSTVAQMQSAADDLTVKGGFTTPGFMGVARGQIANAMETIENMFHTKFTGDATLPAENADIQTINKWHANLAFQLKKMMDGTGARGLGVLMEASSAVPSMENTPLAFKVLTAGLSALANWDIGKYEYKGAYMTDSRTGGTLLGADQAYNNVSSPLDAAKAELGKIGVVLDGSQIRFKDDTSLKMAYETGLFGKKGTEPAMNAAEAMHKLMHPELYKKEVK